MAIPQTEILLLLDANEALGSTAHGITSLMRECKLIDLFHHHHGVCPEFATFDMGISRLDYALGSPTLLPFLLRCGYLPFYQGVASDHRGLFLDLSFELIDETVYRYKHFVSEQFESHKIFQKAADLYNASTLHTAVDPSFLTNLNALDSLIVSIQLKAEQTVCRLRTKMDFSDEIHYSKIVVAYWNLKRKEFTRKMDVSVVATQIYTSLPESYQRLIDIAGRNAYHNCCNAKNTLRRLMVEHRNMLAVLSKDLIDNEAAFTGKRAEDVIRTQEQKKQDKQLYASLRQHFHPVSRSGIAHLLIPDKDQHGNPTECPDETASWKSETDPTMVLEKLLHRNIQHFGQADGTPFTTEPLLETFGYTGMTSPTNDLINDGIIPHLDPPPSRATSLVLNRLADKTKQQPPDLTLLNFDSFKQAMWKWRESTSTSPSGRHLGHYKSLIAMDSHSSKYTDDHPDPGNDILQVLFFVAASAFNSGLTLERWRQVTTCMIEKLPGLPRINKLRVIHLYEADYNACLKLVWQRGIVWTAHNQDLLNPAQAGSRPNHTCIETVMSKELKYMYSILTRSPMATMDNDAKSCYDRVVASLALIISHHFGVPAATCSTVGLTLQNMIFRIRTALGDSEQDYSHSATQPSIHGVGQGGTASPALWLLVSSILFDCFQSQAQGMTMLDPTMNLESSDTSSIRQWIEAIVDDTSIFTNLADNPNIADLIQALQQDSQLWEQLLSTSGGCLELSKCFYYILAWVFSNEGIPSPMSKTAIDATSPRIQLQEFGQTIYTTIQTKAPYESHKTLGVWKTMLGDDSVHIKTLESRSRNMAAIVASGSLHPYQADVAVRMMYTPAMGYSLPSVNVSEAKLNKIQYKALESFIPAMGFNRNFPQCIVLGPSDFGGLGVPHLYTEASIQKIELMTMHICSQSPLGKLFVTMLNWTQMHIGTDIPLLEDPSPIKYVDNWFTGVQKFLHSVNGKVVIPMLYRPKLERTHDRFLMLSFQSLAPPLSANQLRHLNAWRFHFQVHTTSDITNAAGNTILDVYFRQPSTVTCQPTRTDRVSKILWPYQPAPASLKTVSLWVRTIRRCLLHPHGMALRQPLGKWLVTPTSSLSKWQSYIQCDYKHLILAKPGPIQGYSTIQKQTATTILFSDTADTTPIPSIPSDYIPVDISTVNQSIVAVHQKQKQDPNCFLIPNSPRDIQEAIRAAPLWQQKILQHFRIHDLDMLIDALTNDTVPLLSVSDGDMRDGIGSFGVTVGTNSDILYYIEGPAPGFDELMTSFRSEAYGMLASLSFLKLFLPVHQIHIQSTRTIMMYCDNLALVNWINKTICERPYPRLFLRSESDVIMQIVQELSSLRKLNIHFQIRHVLGHQDKDIPYEQLSRPAQLNVEADHHATNYLDNCKPMPYRPLPSNPVSIYINDNIITRDLKHQLRIASCSPALHAYFLKRFNLSSSIPSLIWWQVHGSTIKSFSKADRRRITKFYFRWLPTCESLHKYDKTKVISDKCPSCKVNSETHQHIITCIVGTRLSIKNKWLDTMTEFLKNDRYTPPPIGRILLQHLTNILASKAPPTFAALPPKIQTAYDDQSKIGWFQLLNGRLALNWGNCIATYLYKNKIPDKEMTALSWGRKFNKMMFRLSLDLWERQRIDAHQTSKSSSLYNSESPLLKQRLIDQIIYMQQSQPEIRYYERDFVYKPLSILKTYRLSQLKAWYHAACSIIKFNKKRLQNRPTRNAQNIAINDQASIHDPDNPSTNDQTSIHDPDNPSQADQNRTAMLSDQNSVSILPIPVTPPFL